MKKQIAITLLSAAFVLPTTFAANASTDSTPSIKFGLSWEDPSEKTGGGYTWEDPSEKTGGGYTWEDPSEKTGGGYTWEDPSEKTGGGYA